MPRFFVLPDAISESEIRISGDDAYHIARALRMAVGDEITIADGRMNEYLCRLSRIRDEECLCEIINTRHAATEPPHEITLYMAYPKGDKMETVTQKAVELGASHIVPFESERCIKRPSGDKADKIAARLTRIAHEAAKQCGRAVLPTVDKIQGFTEMLALSKKHSLTLFCYEGEGADSLKKVLGQHGGEAIDIGIIIGSEGGFSLKEAEKIIENGAQCVNLGPRILRCETAPDYVLSALSYFFEL